MARDLVVGRLLVLISTVVFALVLIDAARASDDVLKLLLKSVWLVDDPAALLRWGGLGAAKVWLDGQWWRLITALFVHGSWLHLLLNMAALRALWPWCVGAWGRSNSLWTFLVTGLCGNLLSLATAEAPLIVGASGGIFGLGAAVAAGWWAGPPSTRDALDEVDGRRLAAMLGFWLVGGALASATWPATPLAQHAHEGGFIAGLIWSVSRRVDPRGRLGWCLVLGLVGLGWSFRHPTESPDYMMVVGEAKLDADEADEALGYFRRALAAAPDDPDRLNAVAYASAEVGTDLEMAEGLVRRALELKPGNPAMLDTLGWVLCRRGAVEEGTTVLQRALGDGDATTQEHIERCASVAIEAP